MSDTGNKKPSPAVATLLDILEGADSRFPGRRVQVSQVIHEGAYRLELNVTVDAATPFRSTIWNEGAA
ncbi:hypothetical protein ORIO_12465 [Cereibacter azotoformans]|uniref:hypothetical protein n=1 Tax=Cereibacter azotoformans TaxID=43057 RepID=UPI001EECEE3B|nr:hypothetical protein [Cereibacter azotoformans]ULB10717.1 hypothetical protein ORIO_12465 [Cereibacter azotoformans]